MVQELLGHKDLSTTIYTHVLNKGGRGVKSPLDRETWVAPVPHKAEEPAAVYRVAPAAA